MTLDIESILAPIPGDNPAGENLRYADEYSRIKEARRADDLLDQGEWQHEVKTSDWDLVKSIAIDALTNKSKDIQIAVWLIEALMKTSGYTGLANGLEIMIGLLENFWDGLYPEIDEGDLDYRIAPLEFMNEKLWVAIKEITVTDPRTTSGYSWIKWQESRDVGAEASTRNQWGDVDESRKNARDAKIAEGKLTAEDFDSAVAASSFAWYTALMDELTRCREGFRKLDQTIDEKFGDEAPRLAEFRENLEECHDLVAKLYKEKKETQPMAEPEPEPEVTETVSEEGESAMSGSPAANPIPVMAAAVPLSVPVAGAALSSLAPISDAQGEGLWNEALHILNASGIKTALAQLMSAACGAPSIREKNRYRLIMAKLCLSAARPDLALPIAEELYALIEELSLEKWESSIWIGEVIDTLYQCLTKGDEATNDPHRAQELLKKLCTTDVTKAMIYRTAEESS